MTMNSDASNDDHRAWTFLSNHAHVLVCIAQDRTVRVRDIALRVGITERAASSIVADLEHDGYLTRIKVGRNNEYDVHSNMPLRHQIEQHRKIGDLLQLVIPQSVLPTGSDSHQNA
jgi:hypothetical protein